MHRAEPIRLKVCNLTAHPPIALWSRSHYCTSAQIQVHKKHFELKLTSTEQKLKYEARPITISFAMTYHQFEGQTRAKVALNFNQPAPHSGNLTLKHMYVGMSRVTSGKGLRILPYVDEHSSKQDIRSNQMCEKLPRYMSRFDGDGTKYAVPHPSTPRGVLKRAHPRQGTNCKQKKRKRKTKQGWFQPKTEETCTLSLGGHTKFVSCVTGLANGQVVSRSWDKTLRIWDAEHGTCVNMLEGHNGAVNCVTNLSNRRIASCVADKSIRVWDTEASTYLMTIPYPNQKTRINSMYLWFDRWRIDCRGGWQYVDSVGSSDRRIRMCPHHMYTKPYKKCKLCSSCRGESRASDIGLLWWQFEALGLIAGCMFAHDKGALQAMKCYLR